MIKQSVGHLHVEAFVLLIDGLNYAKKFLFGLDLVIIHPNGASEVDRGLPMALSGPPMLESTRGGHDGVIVELMLFGYIIQSDKNSWIVLILSQHGLQTSGPII